MSHICGSYYLLGQRRPRCKEPWSLSDRTAAEAPHYSAEQSRMLLQGGTAGLKPCSFGGLPYVPCVRTCSRSAKAKRDAVTPRVKGMGEEHLRQDVAMTIIHSDSGKTSRENDKSWEYRDFSTQIVISTKVQNSSVLFAHPNLHHSN